MYRKTGFIIFLLTHLCYCHWVPISRGLFVRLLFHLQPLPLEENLAVTRKALPTHESQRKEGIPQSPPQELHLPSTWGEGEPPQQSKSQCRKAERGQKRSTRSPLSRERWKRGKYKTLMNPWKKEKLKTWSLKIQFLFLSKPVERVGEDQLFSTCNLPSFFDPRDAGKWQCRGRTLQCSSFGAFFQF